MVAQTAKQIAINIAARVYGEKDVEKLTSTLAHLKQQTMAFGDVKKMVTAQTKQETQQLTMSNQVLRARANLDDKTFRRLAIQNNARENYSHQFQQRMSIEQGAYRLRRAYAQEGIVLTQAQARVATAANQEIIVAENAATAAIQLKRRALMQVSISMFVFNISVGQMVSSLLPLAKSNEEVTKALKEYQAVLMLSMGPMQAYMAIKMIQINLEKRHQAAVFGVISAMSAAYFWYAMITTKSRELKIVLGMVAAVMTVLAVKNAMVTLGLWQNVVASAALKSIFGDMSGWMVVAIGLGVAAAVGAVIGGLLPTAQTRVGQMKKITKSGVAEVHEGEIFRPAAGEGGVGGMGGGDTIIYLPEGYTGSVAQSRFFAREVDRLVRTGQSSLKVKRKVVPSG